MRLLAYLHDSNCGGHAYLVIALQDWPKQWTDNPSIVLQTRQGMQDLLDKATEDEHGE